MSHTTSSGSVVSRLVIVSNEIHKRPHLGRQVAGLWINRVIMPLTQRVVRQDQDQPPLGKVATHRSLGETGNAGASQRRGVQGTDGVAAELAVGRDLERRAASRVQSPIRRSPDKRQQAMLVELLGRTR